MFNFRSSRTKEFIKRECGLRFKVSIPAFERDGHCKQTDIRDGTFYKQFCGLQFMHTNWKETLYVSLETVDTVQINRENLFFFQLSALEDEFMGLGNSIWIGFDSQNVKVIFLNPTLRFLFMYNKCLIN